MKRKLDLIDRKILHALDCDARQPVSAIARRLRLSREIVSYRMQKFIQENLLLKYFTIIDIAKLGYAAHKQFLRFQNMTEKKELEFYNFVQQHPKLAYSANYEGRFDVVVSILARNVEELGLVIKEIDKNFGPYMAERQMATILRGEYSPRDYLVGNRVKIQQNHFFGSVPKNVIIDDIDKEILFEFSKNARASIMNIAERLKLSADAIYMRIKKLQQSGVLQNYNIVPNEENYPWLHYKILFALHHTDEKTERKLIAYCRSQKNIWYFCQVLGPWDFEIDLDVKDSAEFRSILRGIKLQFSEIIKEYTVMVVFRTNKYNFYPSLLP